MIQSGGPVSGGDRRNQVEVYIAAVENKVDLKCRSQEEKPEQKRRIDGDTYRYRSGLLRFWAFWRLPV